MTPEAILSTVAMALEFDQWPSGKAVWMRMHVIALAQAHYHRCRTPGVLYELHREEMLRELAAGIGVEVLV